jgi:hypothetical protein
MVLSSAILPQSGFGQIPTLDKLNLDSNQSPQCLDFNQDKICEFIVLANGTMVENPNIVEQTTQVTNSNPDPTPTPAPVKAPVKGKCLGMANTGYFCENVLLANGTMVKNPNNPSLLTVGVDPGAYYSYPTPSNNDDNNNDDNGRVEDEEGDNEEKTYCDVPNPSNPCHDRYDVSETTGLATCIDGSHEEDPEDCKGGGAEDDNNDDSVEDEEETANCGGEPCTPTEKEDSWTDEEVAEEDESGDICYANDNGSLLVNRSNVHATF